MLYQLRSTFSHLAIHFRNLCFHFSRELTGKMIKSIVTIERAVSEINPYSTNLLPIGGFSKAHELEAANCYIGVMI